MISRRSLFSPLGIKNSSKSQIPKGENRDLLDVIEKASAPAPQMALKGLKEEEPNDSTAKPDSGKRDPNVCLDF